MFPQLHVCIYYNDVPNAGKSCITTVPVKIVWLTVQCSGTKNERITNKRDTEGTRIEPVFILNTWKHWIYIEVVLYGIVIFFFVCLYMCLVLFERFPWFRHCVIRWYAYTRVDVVSVCFDFLLQCCCITPADEDVFFLHEGVGINTAMLFLVKDTSIQIVCLYCLKVTTKNVREVHWETMTKCYKLQFSKLLVHFTHCWVILAKPYSSSGALFQYLLPLSCFVNDFFPGQNSLITKNVSFRYLLLYFS